MPAALNPTAKPKPVDIVNPKPASPSHGAEGDDASTTTAHTASRRLNQRIDDASG